MKLSRGGILELIVKRTDGNLLLFLENTIVTKIAVRAEHGTPYYVVNRSSANRFQLSHSSGQ